MSQRRRGILLGALAVLLACPPASAQRAEFVGRGDIDTDALIKSFLAAGNYRLIARDTLLARTDTLRGPVLATGATLRIEGVIAGDLLIVDSNVFLRPTGRVTGNVTNIAGGFYPSEQATITGQVVSLPNAPYDVERDENVARIVGMRRSSLLEFEGFRGVRIPSYDRVNGVTLGIGIGFWLPRVGTIEPILRGRFAYHSHRGDFGGGAELGFVRGPTAFRLGAQRETITNEHWVRSTMLNSTSFLFRGKDYRNYYEADRFYVGIERLFGPQASTLALGVSAQAEDASSLRAGDPWSVFSPDSIRPNPRIDDGRIASLLLDATAQLERPTFLTEIAGRVEVAREVLDADHEFARFQLSGTWAMQALANHTLQIDWQFQGPLPGTDSLPRQRWSFVGGSGTLYTFEIGEFPGDRIAYVESEYIVPLPERVRVPLLGTPELDLLHHIGMAWSHDVDRDLEQNVGLRLRFPLVYLRVVTNPAAARADVEFAIGVNMPRSFPWQSREDPETR